MKTYRRRRWIAVSVMMLGVVLITGGVHFGPLDMTGPTWAQWAYGVGVALWFWAYGFDARTDERRRWERS